MAAVNPYLHFNGNAEQAFNFYKSVFGGEFLSVVRYKDAPGEHNISESEGEKIMHVALPLGQGTMIMASDVPEAYGKATIGTNFYISINAQSEEEADKLFNGLSVGGRVLMSLEKSFWGAYFGMFVDQFGVQWMVSYEYNQQR